ncbi:RnfABCDGE type electron transport complex subunit G [Anaerolentibacter hominis]|uniref:RnfABCDGE type electron transport complex subunit G n=1 Tax=Anaerolentibacter hominis TaxID=3079009 RepID=UPI0031B86D81
MKTILKDALILFAITLVSGLLLGFIFDITKEPIEAANEKATQEAYRQVFPEADVFEESQALNDNVSSSEQIIADLNLEGVLVDEAMEAKNTSGDTVGIVMKATSNNGYGGAITISLGVDNDGVLTGIKVLQMSETAGLGAKCQDEDFQNQFSGIRADMVQSVKTGAAQDNEIDAISGATFTTNAVTEAVNAGLAFAKYCRANQ